MSDGDETSDSNNHDPESLIVSHEEARAVLGYQIELLSDIDDKALRSVRIVTVLLGLLISAVSIASTPTQFVNFFTILGTGLLFCSLIVGVLTYTVAAPNFGPGPDYFWTEIDQTNSERRTRRQLLHKYGDWISSNQQLLRVNSSYLFVTQLLLIGGLLLFTVGVAFSL
jgi:hypothetical protein